MLSFKKKKKPARVKKGGFLSGKSPTQVICGSFLILIAVGTLLLMLPAAFGTIEMLL